MNEILSEVVYLFSIYLYLLFIHVILWHDKKLQTSNDKHFTKLTTTLIETFLCFYLLGRLSNPLETPQKPYDIPPEDPPPRKTLGSQGRKSVHEKKYLCTWKNLALYIYMQFQKDFGLTNLVKEDCSRRKRFRPSATWAISRGKLVLSPKATAHFH